MNKTKIRVMLPTIATRPDAEAAMNDLARVANDKRKFLARRDAEMLAVSGRYETHLAACDAMIEQKTDALRVWAETHSDEFPAGRKSLDFASGVLGFRTGTPKLTLLSRAWTWDTVTEALGRLLPDCIRNQPEVDKECIIRQRVQLAELLPRVGLKVTQGESFYVEPKLGDTTARLTQKAA